MKNTADGLECLVGTAKASEAETLGRPSHISLMDFVELEALLIFDSETKEFRPINVIGLANLCCIFFEARVIAALTSP